MKYIVRQSICALDTDPKISTPLEWWEAEELASEWLMETVDHIVQHSPHSISEEEYENIVADEMQLIQIQEVSPTDEAV